MSNRLFANAVTPLPGALTSDWRARQGGVFARRVEPRVINGAPARRLCPEVWDYHQFFAALARLWRQRPGARTIAVWLPAGFTGRRTGR